MADTSPMDGGREVRLSLHPVQVDYLVNALSNFISGLEDDIVGHPDDPNVELCIPESIPKAAAIVFDLDDFRRISDTLRHTAGDEVLRRFAGLLEATAVPRAERPGLAGRISPCCWPAQMPRRRRDR